MKVLLTGAFKYSEDEIKKIESLGYEVTFIQDERIPLDIDVSGFEAVVCNGLFLYNDIKEFKSLKFIQLTSAGLDRVPIDYINKNGIILKNAKGVYSAPMAEFVISGVLQLYKHSKFFFENQKEHCWEKHRGLLELTDKNILIIGAGSVGSEIAKRFKAFDTNVVGIDIISFENEFFDKIYSFDKLEAELPKADVVVLSLPLTAENEGFFDKHLISLMKNTAVFVNVARGKLVNQGALEASLIDKKLFGAVLDVFEEEPLSNESKLWDLDNIILTPHNSFIGEKNNLRLYDLININLMRFVNV